MLVMEIMIYSILILFIAAAREDHKKREVGDYVTIAAWVLSAFVFDLQFFILFFAGSWAIASLCEKLKQPIAGFGDVLWMPVFASLVTYLHGNAIVLSLVAILVSQIYLWYRIEWLKVPKKGNYGPPFLVVLLGMLVVAFLISLA